jgi:superfamily II DNA or RNA helicase
LDYFGGILEPRYTLADAVRDRVLVPYFYRPHPVDLTEHEATQWRALTAEVARLRAQIGRENAPLDLAERIERLLIRRARVVKHAAAKVPLAVQVLTNHYEDGQRWLVYCDDQSQLDDVSQALTSSGVPNVPYHSAMEGNRAETLRWLEHRGGVVVAIKCLDEGVDIPSVTHALILASSKNPREFIQRRGRVLRTDPTKALAYIHDAIVLPPAQTRDARAPDSDPDPVTLGELARAIDFAAGADNPASASDLAQIAIEIGADWRALIQDGIEDRDDQDAED